MKPNFQQSIAEQWKASDFLALQSATTAADFLLDSLAVEANDYLVCDPLIPTFLLKAIQTRKAKVLFIDLNKVLGHLDVNLLEDFLSLSTLINEKDELIYRKDNRPIKGIISSTRWQDSQTLKKFLFTAQRYYLKTIVVAGLNDLLATNAKQHYQADLITGALESAGVKAQIVLKPELQNKIARLSGSGKDLKTTELKLEETVTLEDFQVPKSIWSAENVALTNLRLPQFLPGHAQLWHQDRESLRTYLTASGFFHFQPFEQRQKLLRQSTFMSRSKAGLKYLDQNIEVLITHPREVQKLRKVLQKFTQNTTK